jgi:hypothetical protein
MTDAGRVAGPLLVGIVADSAGLGWASWALAGVAALAVLWLGLVIGETGTTVRSPSDPDPPA